MISVWSSREAVLAAVRSGAESVGAPVQRVDTLHCAGLCSLLVVDLARGVASGSEQTLAALQLYHLQYPSVRFLFVIQGVNSELELLIALGNAIPRDQCELFTPLDLRSPDRCARAFFAACGRVHTARKAVKNQLMLGLVNASTHLERSFEHTAAMHFADLLDRVPECSSVKALTAHTARRQQHREWLRHVGERRIPTNLAIVLFRALWFRTLLDEGLVRREALAFLHLDAASFNLQLKRRLGLTLAGLERAPTQAFAAWIGAICISEFPDTPTREALVQLAGDAPWLLAA